MPTQSNIGTNTDNIQPSYSEIATSTDDIQPAQSEIATSTDDIMPTQSTIGTDTSDIMPTQSTIGTDTSDIMPTQSNIGTDTSDIEPTQFEIATSTDDIQPTQSNIGTDTSDIMPTQSEIATSTDDIQPMQSEIATSTDDIQPTQSEISTSTDDIQLTQSEIATSTDDIQSTQSEIATSTDDIQPMQSTMGTDTISEEQSELTSIDSSSEKELGSEEELESIDSSSQEEELGSIDSSGEEEIVAESESASNEDIVLMNQLKEQLIEKMKDANPDVYNTEDATNDLSNFINGPNNNLTLEELQRFADGTFSQAYLKENTFNNKLKILGENLTNIMKEFDKINIDYCTLRTMLSKTRYDKEKDLSQEQVDIYNDNYEKIENLVRLMYLWLFQHCKLRYEIKQAKLNGSPEEKSEAIRNELGFLTLFPMRIIEDSIDSYPLLSDDTKVDRQFLMDYVRLYHTNPNVSSANPKVKTSKYYELMFVEDLNKNKDVKQFDKESSEFNKDIRELDNLYKEFEEEILKDDSEKKFTSQNVTLQYLGGNKVTLINNDLINLVDTSEKNNLENIIDSINNKFNELIELYCTNCSKEEKIKKLNSLFKKNIYNEKELFSKHHISLRDLNLYIYLNIIDFIVKKDINIKFKELLKNTLETIILEHINYSVWYFMYSKIYNYDTFTSKIENGMCNIDPILKYIEKKEKQKFTNISLSVYNKYYLRILVVYILNIKANRDYFNSKKIKNNHKQLIFQHNKNKDSYDYKYFTYKLNQYKSYNNLVDISKIKNNLQINYNKYDKNILELLKVVINIIIYYKNLYLFTKNIFKFFSIHNLRKPSEIEIVLQNFKSYLNISKFIKKNKLTKETLKNILDKLLVKVNKLNTSDLLQQWDIINDKLVNLKEFNDFEIECIKLILAIKYNEDILNSVNQNIKLYNIYKNNFYRILNKLKISYKNISKYNKHINNIDSNFINVDLSPLVQFSHKNLNYLI